MEDITIGIDLGGTYIRVALVDRFGKILDEVKESSEVEKGSNYVIEKMIRMIKSLKDYYRASAIGIGAPGPLDAEKGIILSPINLPGWDQVKLSDILHKAFGLPVVLDNDANVAGLAEALLGAGKGKNIVQYITISTGIGGGLIINGKIISGGSGNAGEIGNIIVNPGGYKHNQLNPGSLEGEASGTAITRKGCERLGKVNNAGEVFKLAQSGNKDAMAIIEEATDYLARGLAAIMHIVDPDIFVLGGGVMQSQDVLIPLLENKLRYYVYHIMQDKIHIVPATLKSPGIIGAAMLPRINH